MTRLAGTDTNNPGARPSATSRSRLRAASLAVFTALGVLFSFGLRAQAPPQRIVSLVPSATEALFAMGAGLRLVGVGSFDTFPPEVAKLPKVGALLDPDVERILTLKPDLMICYTSQTELHTQLRRAGIRLYLDKHGSLADLLATMRQLGTAVGAAKAADALASRLEHDLSSVRARVAKLTRPKVMLVIGRESQSMRTINVSGGYGFLHDLIDVAGGINVFADVKRESFGVSTETVLARAPDVIVELRYSGAPAPGETEREQRVWDALPGVPAVRTHRVHILFGGELVIPGPRVAQTAAAFARAIHPEAR